MKKVFVSGSFNILHPGHLRMLKFAKNLGDKLVVGVYSDKLAGPAAYVKERIRLEGVKSNNYVDDAFIINHSPEKIIAKIKPNFVVKGKEFENKENIEKKILKKYGGKLVFSSGEITFSSLDIINKKIQKTINNNKKIITTYLDRHHINKETILKKIKNFKNSKILVIGDTIVDEYIDCQSLGASEEDASLVVMPLNQKKYLGGAGIVAAHCANLGAKVNFFSIVGHDSEARFIKDKLKEYKVISKIFLDSSRPTTHKKRYRSGNKTLLRVSTLHKNLIDLNLQKKIFLSIKKVIKKFDLIIFSDFNYGCLPQALVDKITLEAKKYGIILIADSQSSSQIGFIDRFKDVDLITATEKEARIATKNFSDGLVIISDNLKKTTNSKSVIIKLASEGILINSGKEFWKTDRIPALNNNPIDVAGAGDSFLSAISLSFTSGMNIWEASYVGSVASAIQINNLGNNPLSYEDLIKNI